MTRFTIEVELRCALSREDVEASTVMAELTRSFALEGLPSRTCSMKVRRSRIKVVIPTATHHDQDTREMRREVLAPFSKSRAVLP